MTIQRGDRVQRSDGQLGTALTSEKDRPDGSIQVRQDDGKVDAWQVRETQFIPAYEPPGHDAS